MSICPSYQAYWPQSLDIRTTQLLTLKKRTVQKILYSIECLVLKSSAVYVINPYFHHEKLFWPP